METVIKLAEGGKFEEAVAEIKKLHAKQIDISGVANRMFGNYSLLMWAIEHKDIEATNILFAARANFDCIDIGNDFVKRNISTIKSFTDNYLSADLRTPVQIASLQIFLSNAYLYLGDIDQVLACNDSAFTEIQKIIDPKLRINHYRQIVKTIIQLAENGKFEAAIKIIKKLCDKKINIRRVVNRMFGNYSLLMWAIEHNDVAAANILFEAGADFDCIDAGNDFVELNIATIENFTENYLSIGLKTPTQIADIWVFLSDAYLCLDDAEQVLACNAYAFAEIQKIVDPELRDDLSRQVEINCSEIIQNVLLPEECFETAKSACLQAIDIINKIEDQTDEDLDSLVFYEVWLANAECSLGEIESSKDRLLKLAPEIDEVGDVEQRDELYARTIYIWSALGSQFLEKHQATIGITCYLRAFVAKACLKKIDKDAQANITECEKKLTEALKTFSNIQQIEVLAMMVKLAVPANFSRNKLIRNFQLLPSLKVDDTQVTELMSAAWIGDVIAVKAVLEKPGININQQSKAGFSALEYALLCRESLCGRQLLENYQAIVELLLQRGAKINMTITARKANPLFFALLVAMHLKNMVIIKQLIKKPAINIKNVFEGKSLMNLLRGSELLDSDIAESLIARNACIEWQDVEPFFTAKQTSTVATCVQAHISLALVAHLNKVTSNFTLANWVVNVEGYLILSVDNLRNFYKENSTKNNVIQAALTVLNKLFPMLQLRQEGDVFISQISLPAVLKQLDWPTTVMHHKNCMQLEKDLSMQVAAAANKKSDAIPVTPLPVIPVAQVIFATQESEALQDIIDCNDRIRRSGINRSPKHQPSQIQKSKFKVVSPKIKTKKSTPESAINKVVPVQEVIVFAEPQQSAANQTLIPMVDFTDEPKFVYNKFAGRAAATTAANSNAFFMSDMSNDIHLNAAIKYLSEIEIMIRKPNDSINIQSLGLLYLLQKLHDALHEMMKHNHINCLPVDRSKAKMIRNFIRHAYFLIRNETDGLETKALYGYAEQLVKDLTVPLQKLKQNEKPALTTIVSSDFGLFNGKQSERVLADIKSYEANFDEINRDIWIFLNHINQLWLSRDKATWETQTNLHCAIKMAINVIGQNINLLKCNAFKGGEQSKVFDNLISKWLGYHTDLIVQDNNKCLTVFQLLSRCIGHEHKSYAVLEDISLKDLERVTEATVVLVKGLNEKRLQKTVLRLLKNDANRYQFHQPSNDVIREKSSGIENQSIVVALNFG